MFLFLLLLSFIQSCLPAYIGRTKVDTRFKRNTDEKTVYIKSLYVLAGGNLSSRVVADNLFMVLEERMKQNQSKAVFTFFNTEQDYTKKLNVKSIDSDSFDGYMILSANDSKWIDLYTEKFVFNSPVVDGYWAEGSGYGNSYDGNIRIELFNSEKKLLYSGIFRLHFDPSKSLLYQTAVNKLIKELSKVKIQLW